MLKNKLASALSFYRFCASDRSKRQGDRQHANQPQLLTESLIDGNKNVLFHPIIEHLRQVGVLANSPESSTIKNIAADTKIPQLYAEWKKSPVEKKSSRNITRIHKEYFRKIVEQAHADASTIGSQL